MKYMRSEVLQRIMAAALERRGLPSNHIGYVVDGLLEASVRGVDTHGVRLFPIYVRELDEGRSNYNPQFAFTHSAGAAATLDADQALGIVAGRVATAEAISRARKFGVGVVAVRNSNHFGPASIYTLEMARNEMIGMSFSNSDALVALFSGKSPFLGTNPISFAAPGLNDELFCLDMATSQICFSKLNQLREQGSEAHSGWAIDANGIDLHKSQDAFAALLPLGGYKGQGLAMMVQILCALLTNSPYDHELSHFYQPPFDVGRTIAHFFLALNIADFVDVPLFTRRLSALMELVRAQSEPGVSTIWVAGDLERQSITSRSSSGIPLDEGEYQWFLNAATLAGMDEREIHDGQA